MLIRWRLMMYVLCLVPLASPSAQGLAQANETQPVILVVGDSLSAEYGLLRNTGWVALLADKLKAEKAAYQIQNSSISGDTTSGGISRLPAALKRYRPAVVIIELGGNDALRGLSLEMTQDNIAKMIDMSQQAHARVLLLGMQIPPNYGRQYTEQFKQIFVSLAQKPEVRLVPFLLEGIATDSKMFQADGIHPNEQAQHRLAQNVWKQLQPMLKN